MNITLTAAKLWRQHIRSILCGSLFFFDQVNTFFHLRFWTLLGGKFSTLFADAVFDMAVTVFGRLCAADKIFAADGITTECLIAQILNCKLSAFGTDVAGNDIVRNFKASFFDFFGGVNLFHDLFPERFAGNIGGYHSGIIIATPDSGGVVRGITRKPLVFVAFCGGTIAGSRKFFDTEICRFSGTCFDIFVQHICYQPCRSSFQKLGRFLFIFK